MGIFITTFFTTVIAKDFLSEEDLRKKITKMSGLSEDELCFLPLEMHRMPDGEIHNYVLQAQPK